MQVAMETTCQVSKRGGGIQQFITGEPCPAQDFPSLTGLCVCLWIILTDSMPEQTNITS